MQHTCDESSCDDGVDWYYEMSLGNTGDPGIEGHAGIAGECEELARRAGHVREIVHNAENDQDGRETSGACDGTGSLFESCNDRVASRRFECGRDIASGVRESASDVSWRSE